MNQHSQRLADYGYEAPFDESPVEVPEDWSGGAVEHTGGGLFSRVWRTYSAGTKGRPSEYRVGYDTNQGPGVALEELQWDSDYEGYIHHRTIEVRTPETTTDEAHASAAADLMKTLANV